MKKVIFPLNYWVSSKLPAKHAFLAEIEKPKAGKQLLRLYFRKWIVHPAKRHSARAYVKLLAKFGTDIIAVTGSVGKTTTKEMIASVLSQKFKTVWTTANIDPVYNIPNTILNTPLQTQKLILEMGIEYPGEMEFYLWLVQPKVAVVTPIYLTHTEFLGSLKNVILEKGKIVENLPKTGYAILTHDDNNVESLAKQTKAKIIWYGLGKKNYVKAQKIKISEDFRTSFTLTVGKDRESVTIPFLGDHFVRLATAAAAVGIVDNISLRSIKEGLENTDPQPHRMTPITLIDKTVLIDDTYNANPLAAKEAVNVISKLRKDRRTIVVLGEMKELGKFEETGHREVGKKIALEKLDYLLTLGNATKFTIDEAIKNGMKKQNTFFAKSKKELINKILSIKRPKDLILVKGSRSMRMEEVVSAIVH